MGCTNTSSVDSKKKKGNINLPTQNIQRNGNIIQQNQLNRNINMQNTALKNVANNQLVKNNYNNNAK